METLRGNKKIRLNRKEDFIFQALEWIAEDVEPEEEEDSSDDGYDSYMAKKKQDGIYTVYVYGMTEKSESVTVKIQEFQPYFYVKVPYEIQEKFNKTLLKKLVFWMKEGVYDKYRNSMTAYEIVLRKEFYGFTKEIPVKFLRFRFQSLGASRAYARLFQSRIKVLSISKSELFYQLYESNIDPILRLCHIQDVKPVGWIKLPTGTFTVIGKNAKQFRTQYEFNTLWNQIGPADNPDIGPIIVASFDIECVSGDGSFPNANRDSDEVIQIGTTCHYHGQKECFLKHMITLGQCNPIEGTTVECYETEEEVLLAWTQFIQKLDPDVITGYNIWGFDLKYMYDRADKLGCKEEFCQLGRRMGKTSKLIEKQLQSSALGQNFFYILEMEGRTQVDIMKVVQRDYKLDMYKLDFVAEHFLKSNKVDLSPKELFAKYKKGGKQNITDIAVYCVQDCELCNRLMNKLEIITNNVGMGNVCHIPFYWLFLRGQGVKIQSLVSRQARLEGFLLKLMKKGSDEDKGYEGAVVLVATPGIYMVPIAVLDYASLYPSSMISENISHDSIVFYKVFDNYGNIVNLQNSKPAWYSMPEFREADAKGKLDEYCRKLGYATNYIESINYEGYYGSLTDKMDDTEYKCERTKAGKKILGKTLCCFVEKIMPDDKEEKSIVPRILQTLLWERRRTRASAFYKIFRMKSGQVIEGDFVKKPDADPKYYHVAEYKQKPILLEKSEVVEYKDKYTPFQQAVLDGLQLAYKVTANSLYGQLGAPTSPIYFKELAAATTATGREMLRIAKEASEEKYPGCEAVYGDSVTGDTPLLLRKPDGTICIKTIESLAEQWDAYDGFKAGESNRREKQQAYTDMEIWVKDKWATIHRVIRHKTKKRIYRVNSHQGCVDVTEDHSLINDCGAPIKADECIEGETKLMHGFPTTFAEKPFVLPTYGERIIEETKQCTNCKVEKVLDEFYLNYENKKGIKNYTGQCRNCIKKRNCEKRGTTYVEGDVPSKRMIYVPSREVTKEEAWIMGFFFGDGSCGEYNCPSSKKGSWALNNNNMERLEKAKTYLEKCEPQLQWKILDTLSSSGVYKLVPQGCIIYIVRKYRELFYDKDKYKIVPEGILNAPLEIRKAFFEGYYEADGCKTGDRGLNKRLCFATKGKISAQGLFYIAKSIGYENLSIIINENKQNIFWVTSCKKFGKNPDVIKKILDLGDCSEDNFVYDIETSESRFNCGIGSIVAKNTDSVFLNYKDYWLKHKGIDVTKLPDAEAVQLAIDTGLECGKYVTSLLKRPQDLEYEKVFYPFVQVSKKRYMAMKYEMDPTKGKLNVNGVALKRRDFCQMVKTIFGGVMEKIIYDRSIKDAADFFIAQVKELLDGKADLKQLIITKTLRATYANPQSIAHAALAEKMRARNDPNKPQANDRVPYVFIQTNAKKGQKLLQGDKVEHPAYIQAHPEVKPDYLYYLEHQIKNPCLQVFALALEQLDGYREGWMDESIIDKLRDKDKLEKEIEDKIGDLREAEAERLLIGEIIRRYKNKLTGTREITDFFAKRKLDSDDVMIIKPQKKKLEPKGIETIKKISEEKKQEVPEEKEQIVDIGPAVKKRLQKIKEAKKEEKKAATAKPAAITQTRKKKVEKPALTAEEKKIKRKMDREEKVKMTLNSVKEL